MMTDSMHYQQSLRRKTRSASICAPGSSSMEQMLDGVPPKDAAARMILATGGKKDSGSATPESSSTPTRRRRPATRSQSARVSGANKSIRRKAAQQGVINRGDSFRKKRSRSNSLAPAEGEPEESCKSSPPKDVTSYNVAVLGARGVGKSALVSQFMSSEGINAYEHVRQRDAPSEQSVFVMLNGEESELRFVDVTNIKELDKIPQPHAYVVMYSVIDKASFQRAEDLLSRLHELDIRGRPVILVGNKIDLVRSRVVSSQDGKCLACTYRSKFAEISVGINHNIDDLLVGILSQIRLKVSQSQAAGASGSSGDSEHWYKSRGVVRASMKARQMLTWLFGKEDRKFKNCENLHVL
ncbi:GTP-binding protein Di-Ras2 isoform X2 [Nasonia vitripennis]|uniref:GTP-binding protein RAD n=1 Tax=Nasonia vitripennis TaxID=7425 RepID=A0A7M7QDV6_NASVI|nr:GTP-binding protein Di-Ras2 isoform X2 [Nasonia vitripennis]